MIYMHSMVRVGVHNWQTIHTGSVDFPPITGFAQPFTACLPHTCGASVTNPAATIVS